MNKLLERQIQKNACTTCRPPVNFNPFMEAISESYDHYEKDREIIERSIEINSMETIQPNKDITKRKDDDLSKAHKQLKTFFEDINDVLYSVDMVSYKLLRVSFVCEKMYGYTSEEFLVEDGLWQKLIYPEDQHIVDQQIKLLSPGKQVLSQYRIIHKDESIRWIENKIIPTFNETGTLIKIDGVTRDISERKRTERELEESVSILEATIESTADGILVARYDGKIVRYNRKFVELWRIPQEILDTRDAGKAIEFVMDQLADPEDFLSKVKELYTPQKTESFDILKFKDGRVFERYSQPQLIKGNRVGRVWSFRDITQRIKTEEALKESETRLRQIIDLVPHFIYAKDTNGKFLLVNEALAKAYGSVPGNLVGKSDADFHSKEEVEYFRQVDLKVINSGNIEYNIEENITDSSGNTRILSTTKIPYISHGVDTTGLLGISIDITEHRKGEETLRKSEMNLEIKNMELEQKNVELEQFAYIASHDLQEPIRTTSSFINLLQKKYHGRFDEKADLYFTYLLEASERMKELIKNLLEYSQIGNKKELKKVDCNEILCNVLTDLGIAIKEAEANIEYDQLPVIEGYATELKQLFQNLITNAIKFRKKDTQPKLQITIQKIENAWQFSFQDNGIGIPEKFNEKIFAIFQRLHNRTEYEGSGIGLSHCKKIVELHKGKIWVKSSPGEGSTFYFTIPIINTHEQIK